jgi:hypothetical protein
LAATAGGNKKPAGAFGTNRFEKIILCAFNRVHEAVNGDCTTWIVFQD